VQYFCIDHEGGAVRIREMNVLVDIARHMYQQRKGWASSKTAGFRGTVRTEFKTVFLGNLQGIEFVGEYAFEGREMWVRYSVSERMLKDQDFDPLSLVGEVHFRQKGDFCSPSSRRRTGIPEASVN